MILMDNASIISYIQKYEYELTRTICQWLSAYLPKLTNNWWDDVVLTSLSKVQLNAIESHHISSLESLDLAALVRIIDRNWFSLNDVIFLNTKYRYSVKRMLKVRNRWAHISSTNLSKTTIISDAQLIYELLSFFDSDKTIRKDVMSFIESVKNNSSIVEENTETQTDDNPSPTVSMPAALDATLKPGTVVRIANDTTKKGVIMEANGKKYKIFIDNEIKEFFKEQLMADQPLQGTKTLSLDQLKCLFTAHQILNTGSTSLYSLNSARIDFVPYQFRPALKLIQSDVPRILIADDVGVGKTIESGLILKELEARSKIDSVLIICPRALVVEHKWKSEMKRFDEDFMEIDSKALKECVQETYNDGAWPDNYRKAIVSYSAFTQTLFDGEGKKNYIGLNNLDVDLHFDLVIVDEAHHIRNSNTFAYRGVKKFIETADAVVFLSATPLQNSSDDLYTLLNALRPDLIYQKDVFKEMLEPNMYINAMLRIVRNQEPDWRLKARENLNKALYTTYGKAVLKSNPACNTVVTLLDQDNLTREDKIKLISNIENLHTFHSIINRTRRKDIDNFCIRRTKTVTTPMTATQRALYKDLLSFEEKALQLTHNSNNTLFMMCTLMRQAASSIYGLVPYMDDFLNKRMNQVMFDDNLYENNINLDDDSMVDHLKNIRDEIKNLMPKQSADDPKFDNLCKIVDAKLAQDNNKLIIFSSFKHTLKYLNKRLSARGVRCGQVDGSLNDEIRLDVSTRFRLPKENDHALDVLLFSEVGCEGLDYQFCDTMINYDLPWNPMRIEQRIGRIDRRGQINDVVMIYNMITEGTIDASIYNKCLNKIGVFENSIGDCEEILGKLTSEINQIMFDPHLTMEEKEYKIKKLADNDVLKIQELRNLEENEKGLFGFDLKQYVQDKDVQIAENQWINSEHINNLVTQYLNDYLGTGNYITGKDAAKNLRIPYEKKRKLLNDFKRNKGSNTRAQKQWKQYLRNSKNANLQITFESECAKENPAIHFITVTHPLVQAASKYENKEVKSAIALRISDDQIPNGNYPFIIHSWKYTGLKPYSILKASCIDKNLDDSVLDIMSSAEEIDMPDKNFDSDWDIIREKDYNQWLRSREKYKKESALEAKYRLNQQITQNENQKHLVQTKMNAVSESKILRMYEGQIRNLDLKIQEYQNEYEDSISKVDIEDVEIVKGVLVVTND